MSKKSLKDRIIETIKSKVKGQRRRDIIAKALVFSKENKNSFVIIGDTKKDIISIAYNDKFMTTDIKSPIFRCNTHIIRRFLLKEFEGTEEGQKIVREFMGIFQTLILNFVRIINKKVGDNKPNN
uniref:Uncharacterized protein n=1 Tax=viral metagenome TaxID=1070528 RepID=A0A6H1ZFL8_9ZZZZ